MNKVQRAVVTAGLALMIFLVVYPPWISRVEGRIIANRYSTIWEAPRWGTSGLYFTIDRDRWTIPLYAVVAATIGFYKLFESKKNNRGE